MAIKWTHTFPLIWEVIPSLSMVSKNGSGSGGTSDSSGVASCVTMPSSMASVTPSAASSLTSTYQDELLYCTSKLNPTLTGKQH